MEDKNELSVVNLTNIDNEDFEGMYTQQVYLIKAGQTFPFPRFLANHLAGQLANKILIREGKPWSDMSLKQPLLDKMLGEVSVPPVQGPVAEAQVIHEIPVQVEQEFPEVPKEEPAVLAPEAPVEVQAEVPAEAPKRVKRGRPKK